MNRLNYWQRFFGLIYEKLKSLLNFFIIRGVIVNSSETMGTIAGNVQGSTEQNPPYFVRPQDECFALLDQDGEIISFAWVTNRPSRLFHDIYLCFSLDCLYIYKAYTLEDHRGRHFYPYLKNKILSTYHGLGPYNNFNSYVEAYNYSSLIANKRLKGKVFGSIFYLRICGRSYSLSTPGCRPYSFKLKKGPYDGIEKTRPFT